MYVAIIAAINVVHFDDHRRLKSITRAVQINWPIIYIYIHVYIMEVSPSLISQLQQSANPSVRQSANLPNNLPQCQRPLSVSGSLWATSSKLQTHNCKRRRPLWLGLHNASSYGRLRLARCWRWLRRWQRLRQRLQRLLFYATMRQIFPRPQQRKRQYPNANDCGKASARDAPFKKFPRVWHP